MRPLPKFLVLFMVCLAVLVLQKTAYSQLRTVETEPPAPAPVSKRHVDTAQADTGGDSGRFYDPLNPDDKVLQKAAEARRTLPLDKRGAVDWMSALRSGAIKPRADVDGAKAAQVLNLDIILKNTKEMPYVRFPHNSHTEWLACSNCHDSLFVPKAGANQITMEKIFRGEFCGACHDRVAFVTHSSCERCHSVPHANSKQWW